ncbi:MAG: hypothetical protein HWN66_00410 [Candidatus Helarchaeota archaeon]|nr:hypothetical protein [Candidatus Helarchaeota archaeon]
MVEHINQIVERGDFSTTSKFYEWSARWKLIQLGRYPRMERVKYAMRIWSQEETIIF